MSCTKAKMRLPRTKRYHKAAREGNVRVLKEANRWEVNEQDETGMTPLLWAASEGHPEAVRVLLKRKSKVSKIDNFGNSALHLAAARGHLDCVKALVTKGTNMYAVDGGQRTACDLARIGEWTEVVEFLEGMMKMLESRNPRLVVKLKQLAGERHVKIKKKLPEGHVQLARQESGEFGEHYGVRKEDIGAVEDEIQKENVSRAEEDLMPHVNTNLSGLIEHKITGLSASTSKSTARSYLVFSELINEQSINQTIVNSLEARPGNPLPRGSPTQEPTEDEPTTSLLTFLKLYELQRIHRQLREKGFDLDRLMAMTEHDIKTSVGLPLGPHRKLCVALEEYKSAQKWNGA